MQERGDVGSWHIFRENTYVRVSFSIKILRHSRGATSYFFREGYTSLNEDTLIKVSPTRHERKSLQGKISLFFHLDTSISNEKFNSQMNTIRPFFVFVFCFFSKPEHFFTIFYERQGRPSLLHPLVTLEIFSTARKMKFSIKYFFIFCAVFYSFKYWF